MSKKWFEKFKNVTSSNLESLLNDLFVQRMFRIFLFYDASRKKEREILMKNQNNSSTTNNLDKSTGKLIFIIRSLYRQLIKIDSCLYMAPCETVSLDSTIMIENDEHVHCDNFNDFISLLAQKFPVTLEKMQQAVDEVYEQIVQQIFCQALFQGLAFVKRRKFSKWKIQWIQVSPGRLYTREIFSRKSRKILCLLDKYSTVLVEDKTDGQMLCSFVVKTKKQKYFIALISEAERQKWIQSLQLAIRRNGAKSNYFDEIAENFKMTKNLTTTETCRQRFFLSDSKNHYNDELLTKKPNAYKMRKISCVQLSSLVVSKIVMHGEKERSGGAAEAACGFITGLVNCTDDEINLEVTNCFPIPKRDSDPRQEDLDIHHQHRTLKYFRTINIDYLVLGYYQTAPFGGFFTETMIQSLIDYQTHDEDSVALVYDPVRCIQGNLDIKAYRLSPRTIELCTSGFTLDVMKSTGVNYSNLLEEIPIVIKNSRLSHLMISKMALAGKPGKPSKFLNMCSSNVLEKNLKLMMINMEVLNAEVVKYNRYLFMKNRYECQKESWIHKRLAENELRRERGEPPLPVEEDFQKIFKMPLPTKVLDGLLAACEINAYANYCRQESAGDLCKLHFVQEFINKGEELTLANMLNVTLHYEKDVDHVFMVLLLRNLENCKLIDTVILQNDTNNIQMDIEDNINWCGLTVTGTYKLADGQRMAKAEFFAFQMITEVEVEKTSGEERSSALLVDLLILPGEMKYHFESDLAKRFAVVVQLMPACPLPNFPQQLYFNASQNEVNIVSLMNNTEFSLTTEMMLNEQQLCWIASIQCFQVDYTYERQCQTLRPKFADSSLFNSNNTGLSKNGFAKWSITIILLAFALQSRECF
ncbi:Eukaryotic translation initiation factor 3 subunit H [Trichinella sp. T6]|nr:Eukaryotic translation initiation factor 3 subunit H [Trichinella sp. T6]